MKILDIIIKFIDKLINLLVVLILIIALAFGGYAIYDAYCVYDDANLPNSISKYKPTDNGNFSLEKLKEQNEDICGWIKIDDTNIDYVVVQGKDNSEYIDKNCLKEYSTAGSIFLDYRNSDLFDDDYSVIYGHNMKSNQMFADVKRFADYDFFKSHNTGRLYTSDSVYELNVLCYLKVSAFEDSVYNLSFSNNNYNKELLEYYLNNAILKNDIDINEKKILMLSTCDVSDINVRSVLVTTMTKVQENNVITKNIDNKLNEHKDNKSKIKDDGRNNEKVIINVKLTMLIIIIILIIILIILLISIERKNRKIQDKIRPSKH